jgi:mycothiol S-conjugate amidase
MALRLMAVHAHPDDESSKGAASSVRYVREGHRVMVVSLTGGERGDILNPALQGVVEKTGLLDVRRDEMALAAKILGVEHAWLGFVDSGFPEGDPEPPLPDGCFRDAARGGRRCAARRAGPPCPAARDDHVRRERRLPAPGPRHVPRGRVAAFEAAGDPDVSPSWVRHGQPYKLYYHVSFHREKIRALHEAALAEGLESPYSGDRFAAFLDGDGPPQGPPITTRVECGAFFGVRDDALRAHATQVDCDGRWFSLPLELQQRVWSTEDFHLARSRVEAPDAEDDLFAGIQEEDA